MAQYFYSNTKAGASGDDSKVVVGTSAPTADLYVQVLTTNNPNVKDVILFLKQVERYLIARGLPAGQFGTDIPNP